ncbi:hypothetical protein Q1M64_00960 (plasmid) [Sinorhizobium meliloti]|nr:hypothetical protein LZK74_07180 [Sinorhizobium meliloti]WKL24063.1 hypothetical protein Q1M63_07850 [Sinorhizobium meliloti]WKL27914.1 hypothetical protein Q1M65_06200 [Sinorhizobium meliloti]WKL33477.1 hypothetical protein Q1M62_05830 [Sinorhizobium meliloti]WKL39366.1 hypothetical protein Q1M64_00960 [Sinorhizobium meliloti]
MTPIWIGLLSVLLGTPFIKEGTGRRADDRPAGLRPHPLAAIMPPNLVVHSVRHRPLCA